MAGGGASVACALMVYGGYPRVLSLMDFPNRG